MPAPEFHLVIQAGSNGEVYNMAIRGTCFAKLMPSQEMADSWLAGANLGGSDGVDVWGTNHWIHDVEVTNRDECVTVKVCFCAASHESIDVESRSSPRPTTSSSSAVSYTRLPPTCKDAEHSVVWCNQSGGSAIGSLSDGTAIEDILYR